MKLFIKLAFGFLLLCITPVILAQESCPALVTSALEAVANTCETTGRNQACYGNISLQAVPQAGVSNFTFEKAGDIVDVGNIQTLTLSSLNADADEWGVALMKVQANVPETLPGQNVTLLLFGDIEVQNAAAATEAATATPPPTATPAVVEVTANSTINVRGEPSTSGAIVGSLAGSTTVKADGRNAAGDWLHIQLEDGSSGWVFAQLVIASGDVNALPETTGDTSDVPASTEAAPAEPTFGPMQAFYFKSGLNDSPCSEAPDSGILIQTPEGAGKIDLVLNEVSISLGSTAYVQAQPGGEMTVNVVEGQGTVSAFGTTVVVPAGTRARVPLDANGAASAAPVGPEPYDATELAALPLSPLPKVVTVAPPLTADEITALGTAIPREGIWHVTGNSVSSGGICDNYAGAPAFNANIDIGQTHYVITSLENDVPPYGQLLEGPSITIAAHTEFEDSTTIYTMDVISSTHIEGITTGTLPEPLSCSITFTFTMDYVGP